jgi:tight adherence protein C
MAGVSPDLILTLASVFLAVALLSGAVAWYSMSRSIAERRLSALAKPKAQSILVSDTSPLIDVPDPEWNRLLEMLPTSRGSVKRLRSEMAVAGFERARTAALFSLSELILPVVLAVPPLLLLTGMSRWTMAFIGAVAGYMGPGLLLSRRIDRRRREIQNGLADALDLLVLCLEAGSSLDQAIVKASEELSVAYPALGDQLRILIAEMRAGKPRLEAFRGLASRTQVDDVRALVAMLVQTDRFGTSIAQALRTHADVCRTKRRQRAEERAQKVGVKLVFPLVFCLFPALYVVMLGPAFIQFTQVFGDTGAR